MLRGIDGLNSWSPGQFRRSGGVDDSTTPSAPADQNAIGSRNGAISITSQTVSMLNLNVQVGELLSNIGGNAQGNQMLQMLIALLILMTLLQQSQNGKGGSADALLDMLSRGADGSRMQMSSTFMSIQQTTTSFVTATDTFANSTSQGGEQLDVSA